MSFNKSVDLKSMSYDELLDKAASISDYLVNKTHFSVETLTRSLLVLEVTMALHYVYDLKTNPVVFDDLDESIIHRYLLNAFDDLTSFETLPDMYQSTLPGSGLGVGCAIALTKQNQVIVVMDDYALNYGTTFESLVQISKYSPDILVVLIDEQNTLLRHYGSMDSMIKSLRISKTYSSIKRDVKSLLSNPVGRPLLGTLTRFKEGLKEMVIEPSIFTQLGFEYQGPINGSNLKECIRTFEMAKSFKGPLVVHVKTRLRRSYQSSIQFPRFKTDQSVPDGYRTYIEYVDEVLAAQDDVYVCVDVLRQADHLADFAVKYPDRYYTSNGSIHSLIDFVVGLALEGKKCVVVMNASDFKHSALHFEEQIRNFKNIVIILRDAGLSTRPGRIKQGVYDVTLASLMTRSIYMGRNVSEAKMLLKHVLDTLNTVQVLRLPSGMINESEDSDTTHSCTWEIVNREITDPIGVIFSYGPSVSSLLRKIRVNSFNIWVVDCKTPLIPNESILNDINSKNILGVVYDVEDLMHNLYTGIRNLCPTLAITNLSISNTDLNLGSKDLKNIYGLNIDNALSKLIK